MAAHDRAAATTAERARKWLGLALVAAFCAAMLLSAYTWSERYYARNIVQTDTSYFLMNAAILLSGRDDFDLRHVLRDPTPFSSSDNGTDVYVLHNLSVWLLRSVLPLRPALAVILNGLWLVAMAASFYLMIWERTRAWLFSALVTGSYLVASPFVGTVRFGLTSLDPNLHSFMVGTSALCWVVQSDHFRRRRAALLAGLFLGFLVMARVYTLGIVLPALLPFAAMGVFSGSRSERIASLTGGALAIAVMFGVSGWWLFPRLRLIYDYPTQFQDAGVLHRTSLTGGARDWLIFGGRLLVMSAPVLCVPLWNAGSRLLAHERLPRGSFNPSHVWLAVCPLLVLTLLGTNFHPYAALALFGIYLTALFPFRGFEPRAWRSPSLTLVLAAATVVSAFGFYRTLEHQHNRVAYDKRPLMYAIDSLRKDAQRTHRARARLGLVHWGILHDASLIDALIFDAGLRVATVGYDLDPKPGWPLVIDPIMTDLWSWDRLLHGKNAINPAHWAKRLVKSADYAIVLLPDPTLPRRGHRFTPWIRASRFVLESGAFVPISLPVSIPVDGPVIVLAHR